MTTNTQESSSHIEEMLQALRANIEYLKIHGNSQMAVKNGELVANIGDLWIYQFELDFFQDLDPDMDIEVRVGYESIEGKVVGVEDKIIQIQVGKSLGKKISQARIIVTSYYLLQLLVEKLEKVKSRELKLTDLAEKTFGLKQYHVTEDNSYDIPENDNGKTPNPYQVRIIKKALGSEVFFVWGPPGTGKTSTIARIVESFLSKEMNILLIAHTNIATDKVLLDTLDGLSIKDKEKYYKKGKIVRYGDIHLKELKEKDMVIVKNILESKEKPIKKALDELSDELENIQSAHQKLSSKLELISTLKKNRSEIEKLVESLNKLREGLKNLTSQKIEISNSVKTNKDKISRYHNFTIITRLLYGLNLENLMREKIELEKNKQEIEGNSLEKQETVQQTKEKIKRLKSENNKLFEETRDLDEDLLKSEISEREKKLNNIKEEKEKLLKILNELELNIVNEASVIGTTLTKSYSSKEIFNRQYDCVILDEASMAPLPAVWCATGLAKQKVVIVGDFYQLPPIVKHRVDTSNKSKEEIEKEEKIVEKWLKTDIFQVSGITKKINEGENPPELEQLKRQYRMHPDIAKLINLLVYEKKGKQYALDSDETTFRKGEQLLSKNPLQNSHIGIYDTSPISPKSYRTDSGSYYNIYQAIIAVELAKEAAKNGYESIGIISPFRAQVNLIQKIIKDEEIENVAADTVHRFQGGQKQIIIFDITTSNKTMLTDDEAEEGDDEKLVNVAFSRAEEKCLLIANVPEVEKKQSTSSLFRKYIEYCLEKNYPIISPEYLLKPFRVLETSEKLLKKIKNVSEVAAQLKKSILFNETDFYPKFISDLLNAKSEVIIKSPFITSERIGYLFPIFEHLILKSIKVFVLTRHPDEHNKSMFGQAQQQIERLEKLGLTVLPFRSRVHEKFATIDRKILWQGSLNILSQTESEEVMYRTLGKQITEQILTFQKLDKNIGKIGDNKLERCTFCKEPGAWYWTDKGRFGYWKFCLIRSHKYGVAPKSDREIREKREKIKKLSQSKKKVTKEGVPICPEHDIPMALKKGPFGQFWGCEKYPFCRITHKYTN